MKCSFIVSTYERPHTLACCLRSLQIQTEGSFEVIITDNSTVLNAAKNQRIVEELNDIRFLYYHCALVDCYASANFGASVAHGEYLCFPSDDGYYGPRFLESMLAQGNDADLIYSDCIYDGHGCHYAPMDVAPVGGRIDKGGFLLRRGRFTEFQGPAGVDRAADAWLIEGLIKDGISHAKVPGFMWVHN